MFVIGMYGYLSKWVSAYSTSIPLFYKGLFKSLWSPPISHPIVTFAHLFVFFWMIFSVLLICFQMLICFVSLVCCSSCFCFVGSIVGSSCGFNLWPRVSFLSIRRP